jgi:catechol 2,3-dioxygenase-like lactoylglutathione lyase family enzyme
MGIKRVVPNFACQDLAQTSQFYTDVLGLQPVMELGWVTTLADPRRASCQVTLLTKDATAPVIPNASIEVDDVDAAYRAAMERGADIVHPLTDEAWGVRRFFVRDPAGNVLNILSHAPVNRHQSSTHAAPERRAAKSGAGHGVEDAVGGNA